ncbi:alanine racemase [soil metagenome]
MDDPSLHQSGPPADLAGAILTIDLAAIQENWRRLAAAAAPAECGAAIKGNAYGLGVGPVARALWTAGCRTYFVARPMEGGELRALLPREAVIYVLDGLFPGQAEYYAAQDLRPALIAPAEAQEWAAFGTEYGRPLPCALHIDTGINRLGFTRAELSCLLSDRALVQHLNLALVMSHLACADEPGHPLNARQNEAFAAIRSDLPGVSGSLANSSGIFLGGDYCHDLVRPGIALYGGNPVSPKPNPMRPVAHLDGTVLQIRELAPGESAGYGATWQAARPSRVAILGAGYKDGVPRALSSRTAINGPAQVLIAGQRCPVIGRISMDMMAVDITDVSPDACSRGTLAEIIGPNIAIDDVAEWSSTVSYELLTRLGQRFTRLYSGGDSPPIEAKHS